MGSGPFLRPRLGISRCIEIDHCRYNGEMIGSEFVRRLKAYVDFVSTCPEVEIGLGVPRNPIRIVLRNNEKHLVQTSTGRELTTDMKRFSDDYLDKLGLIDGYILKSRSPSCGAFDVRIYPDTPGGAPIRRTSGMFGERVMERLGDLPVEDESRLRNIKLGEHFLTRIFILRAFRELTAEERMSDLIDFHARNKYLLMMYNQKEMRVMGNLVANRSGADRSIIFSEYRNHLGRALSRPPRCTSSVNVLMHALGHFSNDLRREEKDFFLHNLQMYRDARIPLSVCLSLMRSYIIRFGNDYLAEQTFFQPFPEDILEIGVTDSCEWRELS